MTSLSVAQHQSTHVPATCPDIHADEVLIPVPLGWAWTLTAPNGSTVTGRTPTQAPRTCHEADAPDHRTWFDDGLSVPVTFGSGPSVPWDILAVSTNHDTTGATSTTASIQLINDHWINDLGPRELTDLATKGHALLDTIAHAVQSAPGNSTAEFAGIRVPITSDDQPTREREILASTITYIPATSTQPPTPTVNIHIIDNCWITNLTLAALTDFTTRARAYFTMLTEALRPALITPKTTEPSGADINQDRTRLPPTIE